jgi:hypothetical protein
MTKKQLLIYATEHDIQVVMAEVNLLKPLLFVQMGLFNNAEPIVLEDAYGLLSHNNYLVCEEKYNVRVRTVPQRKGGIKFGIDPMENINTVVLRLGGSVENKRLISGDVSTTFTEKPAKEIFNLIAIAIRRSFKRIQSYHVGPEALELFDKGVRLTPTAKSPENYDLIG